MTSTEDDLKSVSRSVASEAAGPGMSVVRFNAFDDLFVLNNNYFVTIISLSIFRIFAGLYTLHKACLFQLFISLMLFFRNLASLPYSGIFPG